MSRKRVLAFLVVLAITALVIAYWLVHSRKEYIASKGLNGYDWEAFTKDERTGFLTGYIIAFREGYVEACATASGFVPTEKDQPGTVDVWTGCIRKRPTYGNSLESYSQQVTEYYQEYPQSRTSLLRSLLRILADDKTLSLEEIHRRLEMESPNPSQ